VPLRVLPTERAAIKLEWIESRVSSATSVMIQDRCSYSSDFINEASNPAKNITF
jgi:hypothetical protein